MSKDPSGFVERFEAAVADVDVVAGTIAFQQVIREAPLEASPYLNLWADELENTVNGPVARLDPSTTIFGLSAQAQEIAIAIGPRRLRNLVQGPG